MKLNRFGKFYQSFFHEARSSLDKYNMFNQHGPYVNNNKFPKFVQVKFNSLSKKLFRAAGITLLDKRFLRRKRKCTPNCPVLTAFTVNVCGQEVTVRRLSKQAIKIHFNIDSQQYMFFCNEIFKCSKNTTVSNHNLFDPETIDFTTEDEGLIFQYNTLFNYNLIREVIKLNENLKTVVTIAELYQAVLKSKVHK